MWEACVYNVMVSTCVHVHVTVSYTTGMAERFEEYPKLKELIRLKVRCNVLSDHTDIYREPRLRYALHDKMVVMFLHVSKCCS